MPHKITLEVELSTSAEFRGPISPNAARILADDVKKYLTSVDWGWGTARVTSVSPVPWVGQDADA